MNYSDLIIFIIEIIGTIAFAWSGALTAIKKNMDIFGISVLGVTTAVGGGLIRDLILDINPPSMFSNSIYTFVAVITCIILFLFYFFNKREVDEHTANRFIQMMNICDSIGLGVFTVLGVDTAASAGYEDHKFLMIFVGVLTGVGGGVLRDIMAQDTPFILVKHVYACASIAGGVVCAYMLDYYDRLPSIVIGAAVTIIIRVLAIRYRWNLPHVKR